MLAVEVVEQRAFGGAGHADDVVQAAALKAIGVELGEGRLEDLPPRGLRGSERARHTDHAHKIQTSRYVVKSCAGKTRRELQNASLAAGLALLDAVSASQRTIYQEWDGAARRTQSAGLDEYRAEVRAAERVSAPPNKN